MAVESVSGTEPDSTLFGYQFGFPTLEGLAPMRVPTGPGKIDDKSPPPSGPVGGKFGLLYNFDIDDATVKPEHQTWLRWNAARLLKASPRVEVLLKGTTSRSGSMAYNEALSQRRTEAVQKCLVADGVPADRIHLKWVGELEAKLAGEADGTENEKGRAVAVLVRRIPTLAAQFVRMEPRDDEDGFEPIRSIPWLMLPAMGGERVLRFRRGGGMVLRSTADHVAALVDPVTNRTTEELVVPDDSEPIRFRGGMPGNAKIIAIDVDGIARPLLEIDTLPKRTATVGFYYVRDKKNKTDRKIGEEKALIAVANRVFNRQANVFFEQKKAESLFVNEDWGDPVGYDALGGVNLTKLRKLGDTTLRIRVFFLWNYNPGTDDTDAEVDDFGGVVVAFEDDAGKDQGLSMAHEFGHNLGLRHRKTSKRLVMWPFTDQRAGRLERDQILSVNENLK